MVLLLAAINFVWFLLGFGFWLLLGFGFWLPPFGSGCDVLLFHRQFDNFFQEVHVFGGPLEGFFPGATSFPKNSGDKFVLLGEVGDFPAMPNLQQFPDEAMASFEGIFLVHVHLPLSVVDLCGSKHHPLFTNLFCFYEVFVG